MTTTTERPTTYSGFALWAQVIAEREAGNRYFHRRNTTPCTCAYCRMTEDEIAEYRRKVRRQYGLKEEYGYIPENEHD